VKQPLYVVRLAENSPTLEHGQKVFYVPELASYVFTQTLLDVKGSDASNIYDEEVDDEVIALIFHF